MKKIINGSRYDTETAQRLGGDQAKCLSNDFNYWEQDLYRTRVGKYFLHKKGFGYALQDGNLGWGEEIIPINEDAARQWAELHLDGDAYEAAFGEVDEAAEDARLNILLPQELLDKLDARSVADSTNRSEIVRAALRAYLGC